MATNNYVRQEMEHRFTVASMLAPPEPSSSKAMLNSPVSVTMSRTPSESSAQAVIPSISAAAHSKSARIGPLTPPISPPTPVQELLSQEEDTSRDPILFSGPVPVKAQKRPLFADSHALSSQPKEVTVISNFPSQATRSEHDEKAELEAISKVTFTSRVNVLANTNYRGLLKHNLEILDFLSESWRSRKAEKKATVKPSNQRALASRDAGIRKKVNLPRTPKQPKVKQSPPSQELEAQTFATPGTPPLRVASSISHTPLKTPKITVSKDDDFASLDDFSPPIALTLGNDRKALKADWKAANPLDLSSDPNRHLLHDSEVTVASTLRLTCASYLTNKRRIFIHRVQCLQKGKEFRKTDAQKACNIDVNKASRLWMAFDRVGWFDEKWFVGKHA